MLDDHTVEMRVWDVVRRRSMWNRCLCGSCGFDSERICEREVTVKLLGRDLKIYWDREENLVYMTGPAAVHDRTGGGCV